MRTLWRRLCLCLLLVVAVQVFIPPWTPVAACAEEGSTGAAMVSRAETEVGQSALSRGLQRSLELALELVERALIVLQQLLVRIRVLLAKMV